MNIVFYSTNSMAFDGTVLHYYNNPNNGSFIDELAALYPDDNFFIVTQKPGMFLLDLQNDNVLFTAKRAKYIICEKQDVDEIADEIHSLKPNIAVAVTFWVTPFDWLGLKDAMVAENLLRRGVKTICNSPKTQMVCFDKKMTQDFLKQNGFSTAKSLYIRHNLFWAERKYEEIKSNTYKEYIFRELKTLHLPLVIKDTVGLSSFSIDVVKTFNEARAFLLSKKNNGDRLVEEFIEGEQFGAEIYGSSGNYWVSEPFKFSVNQYGITSPKQSVRFGPIDSEKYKIVELKQELLKLANLLEINGMAQVDLVFNDAEQK